MTEQEKKLWAQAFHKYNLAKYHIEELQRFFAVEYKLKDGDSITADGTIVRKEDVVKENAERITGIGEEGDEVGERSIRYDK